MFGKKRRIIRALEIRTKNSRISEFVMKLIVVAE
jgi:hypothetical protein